MRSAPRDERRGTVRSMLWVIVIVVALALVGAVVAARRRSRSADPIAATVEPPRGPEPEPMTGLESALAAVTDRAGRPMSVQLDDDSTGADDLRPRNEDGPLLRRALDQVQHGDDAAEPDGATGDGPDGAESSHPPA